MKAKSIQIAELRAARREAGLCYQCGESPPEEGKAACGDCLAVNRARAAASRPKDPVRPALCPECGSPTSWKEVTAVFRRKRRFKAERCRKCVTARARRLFSATAR